MKTSQRFGAKCPTLTPSPSAKGRGEPDRRRLYIFLFALVLGCGSGDAQPIEVVDAQVTVIDLVGEKKTIPVGELYDAKTGEPAVKSVLVIDRRTKQQLFIELDQLSPETQMDSHYILVTEAERGHSQ